MIDIKLKTKKDNVVGFEITGHADFDKSGEDIVCSAVTILAYACVNTLDRYVDDIKFEDNDDLMLLYSNVNNEQVDIIFSYFEIGIETLLSNYSNYIKLHYEEV